MFPINKCQKVKIDQGTIYLGPSDKKQSVGYLELKPRTSLNLHSRPGIEKLTQVKGKCDTLVYKDRGEIITLKESEKLAMEINAYHIHINPYDKISLTCWDFDGDIREIIEDIRKGAK